MFIACDEAGHTGPDLMAKDQRFFAFASVNVSNEEAGEILDNARKTHPVQMPELKASRLMGSKQGRRLVSLVVQQIEGRFAINAHDKMLALCGWVFEYIFEPVYKDDPRVFYRKDFHRFIAMFCYLWFRGEQHEAVDSLAQFQAYMRSKDTRKAPALFDFDCDVPRDRDHPFDLVRRFATGHKKVISRDNANIQHYTSDNGAWTLDLSASCLWSHLNHWGRQNGPLSVVCDDSKPLRAIADDLAGDALHAAVERAKAMSDGQDFGWEFAKPIEFVDSRMHPSVQLADILASTVVHCHSNRLPPGMESTGDILDSGMLRDSIFPDFERTNLENTQTKVNYAVLYELAATAEGNGSGASIEQVFWMAEMAVSKGLLKPS